MAVKIRLARSGAKKRPYYRIVVADIRSPRDGRYIEKIGTYNPMLPKEHEDRIRLDTDRVKYLLSHGAKPTDRVARFLGNAKIIPMPEIRETPQKSQPKEKALERIREKEEKALAAQEAAKQAVADAKAAAEAPAEAPAEEVVPEAANEAEPAEVKAEEAKTEEAPAEEAKAEEAPAEEAPAEEAPAEEKAE